MVGCRSLTILKIEAKQEREHIVGIEGCRLSLYIDSSATVPWRHAHKGSCRCVAMGFRCL